MTNEAIWEKLTEVFRDVFEDDDLTLSSEMTADDVEDWDSLSNVQLLITIEQSFPGLRFNTGEIANLKNVGELVDVITRRVG